MPGTMVSGPDSHTGYRRHYEGEIVTLVTASGNELTITPKHPVLTNRGWVRAGELNVGDKLVSAVRADRNVVSGPDVDHVPSAIENVVSALGMVGSSVRRSVPGSAEQFHGDGFASEVDVVMADYLLRRERDTSLVEPDAELLFHGTSVPSASLCSRCSGIGELDELRIAAGATTDGRMRRSSLLDTLLRGESGSSVLSRLAAVTGRQSGLSYPAGHDGSTDSVLLGQRKNAVSGLVTTGEIAGNWDSSRRPVGVSRKFNPPELQSVTKTLRVFAELGTDLRERLSGSVHLDDLVDKRVGVYHGDVLNLGTQEGWYSANNITVSNCDCIVVPVFDGEPWYGQEHYELLEELWIESTRGLSASDSTKAFAEALKKTNLTKLPDAENDNAAAVDVVSQQRVVELKADERRATAARKPKEAAPLDAFAARAALERERETRFRELGLQPKPAELSIDDSTPAATARRAQGQYLSIPETARNTLREAGVRVGVAPNTDTLSGRGDGNRRRYTADGRALGTTSYYSPDDNAVYIASENVGRLGSGSANVVAHESGHALDYNVLRLNPVTVAWQSPGESEARYRPRYVHEDPYLMWAHNEFVYPNTDIDDYFRTGSRGLVSSGRQEWVAEGFAAMVEGDDALLERISGGSRGADIFRWTMRRLGML
ncbi:Hint domain-containing protein [Rhodococcus sp. 05-2255-3B1]|uniref:Hint domain-containing protein n=1 Tax=Rhodococcus sp. 05-2255-3B1 TaxID=2022482 RepID=UPI001C529068|nr:Hint domain-containing protein [Rhodococcus sp. 05-2255-3B1]